MTSRQLRSSDLNNELQQLYESAFPVEEQIPWANIDRSAVVVPL